MGKFANDDLYNSKAIVFTYAAPTGITLADYRGIFPTTPPSKLKVDGSTHTLYGKSFSITKDGVAGNLPVTSITDYAYKDDITTIGGFISTTTLTSINLPNVTNVTSHGFRSTGINNVSLPKLATIGSNAFRGCNSLTAVTFESVISMDSTAFYQSVNLEDVSMPMATSIGYQVFEGCSKLRRFYGPNVTSLIGNPVTSRAFRYCYPLEDLTLGQLTGTIGDYAFQDCRGFTGMTQNAVTTIAQYAFQGCSGLTTASFTGLTTFGNNALANCLSLTTLDIRSCTTFGTNVFLNISGNTMAVSALTASSGDTNLTTLNANNTVTWTWYPLPSPVTALTFNFDALAGDEASADSNYNNTNLSGSTITRNSISASIKSGGGRFNATGWPETSINTGSYMQFTISPKIGYNFTVSSMFFAVGRTLTGPRGIALRNSLDSYASNLDQEYAIADTGSTQFFTFTFNQAASTNPVTYRVYMWSEATGGGGGIGEGIDTWTSDSIVVIGEVNSV